MKVSFRLVQLAALALGLVTSSLAHADFSMNDVAILLPIPQTLNDLKLNYLSPSTFLSTGPLVTSTRLALFDWSESQTSIDLRQRDNIDRLAVVGIRLDPCFKDNFADQCRPQIRLVLQVITFGAIPTTEDVGIHLFFDTTQENILGLIQFAANYRTQFLGAGSFKAPLQIQPVIAQEGVQGKFWQSFRPMLVNMMNQARFSRIAFFSVLPTGRQWTFKSFNIIGGTADPVVIPGISGKTLQNIDNQIQGSTIEFQASSGVLTRSSTGTDQTFDFLSDSQTFKAGGASRLRPLVNSMERIENPSVHLPGTIDCLSCHSTPSIKMNLRKTDAGVLTKTNSSFSSTILPAMSLINLFEDNYQSRDFRLFGYRGDQPIIGQRVINEAASIVDSISH